MLILDRQAQKAYDYTQHTSETLTPPPYTPVNEKAAQFHQSGAKVNLLPGGNQSGKTTTVAHDHVEFARKCPKGCQGLALTNTYKDIGKQLWPHYKEQLHPLEYTVAWQNKALEIPNMVKLTKNQYKIFFGSYDQGREAHQGSIWDYVHFDEECPYDIWLEVYRGTLAHKARIGYSYTPLEGYEYLDALLETCQDPTEQGYWTPGEPMSLLENPHISQAEKDAWIAMLSEQSRQSRVYGYKSRLGFLVYGAFSERLHTIDPFPIPTDWTFYRGIDYGWDHPTTSIILATDGYKVFVIGEYYQNRRLVNEHIQAFDAQHKHLLLKDPPFQEWGPPLISISDHDAQLRAEYEERGVYTLPAKKSRIAGCEVVRNLLEAGRLLVFNTCKHTIQEFKRYHLPGPDKQGKLKPGERADDPVKEFDDCLDPVRYVCVEQFGYVSWNANLIESG